MNINDGGHKKRAHPTLYPATIPIAIQDYGLETDGFFRRARREEAAWRSHATTSNAAMRKKTRFITRNLEW